MHIVISPAKKIDFKTKTAFNTYTDIHFTDEATLIAKSLKSMSRDKLAGLLNQDMAENKSDVLINLASNEYFKSINTKKLKAKVVTPIFKNSKNGEYKIISIFAKKARGLMTRYIIKNEITNPEDLLSFNEGGYYYNSNLSTPDKPVFTREYQ